jgi:hypothetical protein
MTREHPPMRWEGPRTLPCPGERWHYGRGVGPERPAQPAIIAGPVAGNSTGPSSCGPIFLTRRVNVIGRLSRPVDDVDSLQCGSQRLYRERGPVLPPQARSGGPAGMQLDVDEQRGFDELAGRRPRWGTARRLGACHVDPPEMNHARPDALASGLARLSSRAGSGLPHFLAGDSPPADPLSRRVAK